MNTQSIRSFLKNPWIIALLLLGVFLLTTSYKFGWDDQHLEIPLLKNLIDPSLYPGDYYVASLKENFSSYFYPILSHAITVEQIPTAYFLLYLLSRYFLFFWTYKLWLWISKDTFKALLCVLTFILVIRVDEFLYRTFSHQEFALAIIMAGMYYFFKERFLLTALLLGLTANIHFLYSLFPFIFMSIYLLYDIRKRGWQPLIKTVAIFLLSSLPFLFWIFQNRFSPEAAQAIPSFKNWISLYLLACPQNFLFPQFPQIPFSRLVSDWNVFIHFTQSYLFLIALFILNITLNTTFKTNKKAIAFCLSAFALLGSCVYFTYISPNQFALDLNLIRNSQFLLFLLMGFTTLLVLDNIERRGLLSCLIISISFVLLKYGNIIATCSIILLLCILLFLKNFSNLPRSLRIFLKTILLALISTCIFGLIHYFTRFEFSYTVRINLLIIFILLLGTYFTLEYFKNKYDLIHLKKLFIIFPLIIFFAQYNSYRIKHSTLEKEGSDYFWRRQQNWEDMQKFVKIHTDKDSLLLVPYDMEMGGFRIFSERKIIASYRDCGIVGFDYAAAVQWLKRINDIRAFKSKIQPDMAQAVKNAIVKYNVDYIVFLRYIAPAKDNQLLERVYTNTDFALFRVNIPQAL